MSAVDRALERCRAALEVDDESAIDAPATELLEAMNYRVPRPFQQHREAFLRALGDALHADGDEMRALFDVFKTEAAPGEPRVERGDD